MTRETSSQTRQLRRDWLRIAWLLVALHAIFYVGQQLISVSDSWAKSAAVYFLLLAVVGGIRRWGPMILFTLAAFYFGAFWCPLDKHSEAEWGRNWSRRQAAASLAIVGAVAGFTVEALAGGTKGAGTLSQSTPQPPSTNPTATQSLEHRKRS